MNHSNSRVECVPFLKWPGGKRWALKQILPIARPHLRGRYIEPFLGGGAVFFGLAPTRALLSDVNADLVNAYQMTKEHPRALLQRLKQLPVAAAAYHEIRRSQPACKVDRAVRFIYLNRTCFGGIYRVNKSGDFNVPYGGGQRTPEILWQKQLIQKASVLLRDVEMSAADFEETMDGTQAGDLIYCDPTYTVAHDVNGFVRYNERNFAWTDQERLAKAILRASRRGVSIILSNAHHKSIRLLFRSPLRYVLHRQSTVSSAVSGRQSVSEYLFVWPGRRP
jgi:DNA adenine methylase